MEPLQIGIIILGDWRTTKKSLEYLILYLNTKQTIFEYQLIPVDRHFDNVRDRCDENRVYQLLNCFDKSKIISSSRIELKHDCDILAQFFHEDIVISADKFDRSQIPEHFIFISTATHSDENFFQYDGQNGNEETTCKGAVILTGHHKSTMSPPTILEFIFKFIFRLSIRWKNPEFNRACRHYGTKACLFDNTDDLSISRYMVLHNFVCYNCRSNIENVDEILEALEPANLYGDVIERHPAKVTANLGFNLSLTKGIYKTKLQMMTETLNTAFLSRIGSVSAMALFFCFAVRFDISTGFINED